MTEDVIVELIDAGLELGNIVWSMALGWWCW